MVVKLFVCGNDEAAKDKISASTDGGLRYRVCVHETLRSAPYQH